jgi:uncharacterized protein with HEPN domain
VTRSSDDRVDDILDAIARARRYAPSLDSRDEQTAAMAYDAVLRTFAVIGEAAKALPATFKEAHVEVPWASIAGLRNIVVHEYFRIDSSVIRDVLDVHLGVLESALRDAPL